MILIHVQTVALLHLASPRRTFRRASSQLMTSQRKRTLYGHQSVLGTPHSCSTYIFALTLTYDLIYAVVNSRMDYCNTVLAGAPRTITDKLQRVLNAAARVITGTRKFDRGLGQILHDQLYWLDVPDRVLFKLAVTVHQCLNGSAPP